MLRFGLTMSLVGRQESTVDITSMKSVSMVKPGPASARRLAQQLLRVTAATVALFVVGAWASELLWALIGASLVLTLGDPA